MKLLNLPHRVCESTCFSNGLEDLTSWKGADYMPYLLPVLGGASGFTYLKFKLANPPCMVYWGPSTKYFMRDMSGLIGFTETIFEGKRFEAMFKQLKDFIDLGQPVVSGALDMYYLPYYRTLYGKLHVPIHYVLVVGYNDAEETVYVQDCTHAGVQKISYGDFKNALNVTVPGMSKKNTLRAFTFPKELPSELELSKKGFAAKAERFLNPPVKLFGAPAMRKLSKDIQAWDNRGCFEHMVTYATVPPRIPKTFEDSHGMRFWLAEVLEKLGRNYTRDCWVEASEQFKNSGKLIQKLCESALAMDRQAVSAFLLQIADLETAGYQLILK